MKIPSPIPFGMAAQSIRNWSTSKGRKYEENYDRIFSKRTNKSGYTVVVYRNGKKQEFTNADALSPSQMGLKMIVRGIV